MRKMTMKIFTVVSFALTVFSCGPSSADSDSSKNEEVVQKSTVRPVDELKGEGPVDTIQKALNTSPCLSAFSLCNDIYQGRSSYMPHVKSAAMGMCESMGRLITSYKNYVAAGGSKREAANAIMDHCAKINSTNSALMGYRR
jgi:hypothetical protein